MGSFLHFQMLAPGLLFLAVSGCSVGNASTESIQDTAPSAGFASADQRPSFRSAADPTRSMVTDSEDCTTETAFQPPFPDHKDLFLPPKHKPAAGETPYAVDPDVTLMGFVNVSGLRALLAIDGVVAPLQAGESRGDVRVLSVEPPRVMLERGQRRWTETLFDNPEDINEPAERF